MPRYTLELFNSHGWLSGAESQDFADYDAALACAIYTIRDLVCSEVREGTEINLAHFISIRDEGGSEVLRVHFRDAVSFIDRAEPKLINRS